MKKRIKFFLPEIFVFLFAAFLRFFNLGYPKTYIFDEVYHAFTAQQMAKGNPAAWEWWNTPPSGFAYEWTHPPLAKEFMWLSIAFFGDGPFAWRFFSALFGLGSIVLIYLIASHLFNRKVAIISAFIASLDGLLLVMSRIAMNDSYFLFFSLLAIFLFIKKKNFLMGFFLGLAIASKWTGFFAIYIVSILFLIQYSKNINPIRAVGASIFGLIFLLPEFFKNFWNFLKFSLLYLIGIPLVIYLLAYIPFFLGHHNPPGLNYSNFQTFIELQQQMWWYHTSLKATHPYQSTPHQWIFDLRPVWLYTDHQGDKVANIYTLDNPFIAWFGFASIIYLIYALFKKFNFSTFLIVFSYFAFFIFWIKSPRIMFNYHYLPSTAFLTLALGLTLNKLNEVRNRKLLIIAFSLLLIGSFIYFYPLWVGLPIPKNFSDSHFWFQSWR